MTSSSPTASDSVRGGLRHVTILSADLPGFAELCEERGDVEAARRAGRLLALQEIVITREGAGRVLQLGADAILAVFPTASSALNRALEIQQLLQASGRDGGPSVRIGLHMGEIFFQEGERLEVMSRHVIRARRVMEMAVPGQVLASDAVLDSAKDYIDVPKPHLAIQHFGEYYLKGVGATELGEVADARFRRPEAPRVAADQNFEAAFSSRLESAGYRPAGRLGEGIHGVVYRAVQVSTGKSVAVKVLNPVFGEDPAARRRFIEEIQCIGQLNLEGTTRVIEERLDHHPPFFVMDLIEGEPIDRALSGSAPERIAKVFKAISQVLGAVHRQGLIHGDLKPENIRVASDGTPVILDFGFAGVDRDAAPAPGSAGWMPATPAYVAPEVLSGERRDARSDIYSLGLVLFKVLTGREPFPRESLYQLVQSHLHEDPPLPAMIKPDVAEGLQRICLKAMEKNPRDRYPDLEAMVADLDRFLRGELIRTRPSVYDNLLFHRVHQHVRQIQQWFRRGVIHAEEKDRLLAAYEGMQRRGLPAVMEGRRYRVLQTLIYMGGWAVIHGSLLWLIQHWPTLSRAGKLLLGSVPALTAFALAAGMWKLERFRLTFVALVVGILAVPLLAGVWLYEFGIASRVPAAQTEYELFAVAPSGTLSPDGGEGQGEGPVRGEGPRLTNRQLVWLTLLTAAVAVGVMLATGTTTHSAQAVLAVLCFYTALFLWFGLKLHYLRGEWATMAIKYAPLLLLTVGVAKALNDHPQRYIQAPPWIYFSLILFLLIGYAVALYGLDEWTQAQEQIRPALSYLFLSMVGIGQVTAGLFARGHLHHRCRAGTLGLIVIGLVNFLAGLTLAGWKETWPAIWWTPTVFGQPVPATHAALPLVCLGVALLACRYQLVAFLLLGLAGLAGSVYLLGYLYFSSAAQWPRLLMALGTVCFFAALVFELRRSRGHAIDDVVVERRF